MKTFTIATFVALASVATAQLDNIPSCALNCFVGPLTSDGCSALTDFSCHCKKGTELLAQVQPCVKGACSAADQSATISAVESTCQQAGVPISIPDASSAAPSVAPSSAAAAVSSAVASVESSAAAVASSATEVASSAAEAASSAVASVASSLASVASSALATPTSNSTTSATPSASQFTGGAAQATKAAGLLGAAALAMLAL